MEFHEKLQELRKERGLTQEELAEALFVSRTAVSKWESGRGWPSIDSLKEISQYFSVSIDDLLSGEKLISLAEKENRSNLRGLCEMLFGTADLFSLLLILLPLYPKTVDGMVYSVSLFSYDEGAAWIVPVYWGLYLGLMAAGIVKLTIQTRIAKKSEKLITAVSLCLHIFTIMFLALTRQAYGVTLAFLLLVVKGLLLIYKS